MTPPSNVERLAVAIARVEEKVDALLSQQKAHEKRIMDLERHRNWLLGAIAAIGLVWPFAVSLITKEISQ